MQALAALAGGRNPLGRPRLTEKRRAQILEAAVRVISANGLCDVNIAMVALEAKMSPALVLHYFGTKDRLLEDTLLYSEDRFYTRVTEELNASEGSQQRLVRLLKLTCLTPSDATSETYDDWVLWVELWARSLRDTTLAEERSLLDQRWRQLIARIVMDGIQQGDFTHPDPLEFAVLLGALIDGLMIQILLNDSTVTASWALDRCLKFCSKELAWETGGLSVDQDLTDKAR
ncbi:MAG: TetR/AcrR family transcriptional regulator [Ferrimicrobium sp.]